jgi:hypothetical protein
MIKGARNGHLLCPAAQLVYLKNEAPVNKKIQMKEEVNKK